MGLIIEGESMTKYLVVWFYVANFGVTEVEANSPEEAMRKHLYSHNKDVKFLVVPKNNAHFFRTDAERMR